ncbi:MAG: cytochrome PufQ [Pseudomonadota bacterium]
MTDLTQQLETRAEAPSRRQPLRTEFVIYFAIIFVATLPLACLTWALAAIRSRSFTDKGPMARAWTQARIITPMIFSA